MVFIWGTLPLIALAEFIHLKSHTLCVIIFFPGFAVKEIFDLKVGSNAYMDIDTALLCATSAFYMVIISFIVFMKLTRNKFLGKDGNA
jgi:hypothetical protein